MNLRTRAASRCQPWELTASAKRLAIYNEIPERWRLRRSVIRRFRRKRCIVGKVIEQLLDVKSRQITELGTEDLLAQIAAGALSSVDATQAFCKRSAYAHQLNDCMLDICFSDAIERAKELDAYFRKNGNVTGPLHGLPITLKDQFHVKGRETTLGYVGWVGTFEGRTNDPRKCTAESELVRALIQLGAVTIGKTTVVQTLWYGETNNNILGYNFNPHNKHLSSGGSSGGQGALLALKGSPVGFGTDVGGSVSMPAAFNGVFSIKPSSGRISFRYVANSSPGQQVLPTVVGIMGESILSLQIVFQHLQSTQPWLRDPDVVELPWRKEKEIRSDNGASSTITFGLFAHDGIVTPHPPVQRALRMVEAALRASKYQVLTWEPPSHAEASELLHSFTEADGAWDVSHNLSLSGEPLIDQLASEFDRVPNAPMSLLAYHERILELKDYRARYQAYWNSTSCKTSSGRPIDAVISPVAPHSAVIPGEWRHYKYGSIANVLDSTTIVIPITKANKELDLPDPAYVPLNEVDKSNWLAYDIDKYDGAPAAVQLFGRRFDEEKLLSIAQLVVHALDEHSKRLLA